MADSTVGTGAAAVAAADAVGAVGTLMDRNIELAGPLALAAAGTLGLIHPKPV